MNYLIRLLSLLFLLICGANNVESQNYNIQKLSTKDGLSQNAVYDIIQDRAGFIWLATQNGLSRYDGYDFKTYNHNPFDSLSISGDELLKLFEDSRGRIWIGTYSKGVSCFDKETSK